MIIFKQNANKIVDVADDFATLVNVSENEDLTFEVCFKISKSKALQAGLLKVHIDVATANNTRPNKLNFKTNEQFVDGILKNLQNVQNNLAVTADTIVATAVADITAYINNDKIQQTAENKTPQKLKTLAVLKKDLAKNADITPVFQQLAYKSFSNIQASVSSSLDDNPAQLAEAMLKTGLDPAQITELDHRSISADSNLQGLLRKSRAHSQISNKFSEKLLDYHVLGISALKIENFSTQLQQDDYVLIRAFTDDDIVEIPTLFTIKATNSETNVRDVLQYHVTFKANGMESISKVLDVQKYVSSYFTPDARPRLISSRLGSKVMLEMFQISNKADSIQLLRKTVPLDYTMQAQYETVGVYSVNPGKSIKLFFDIPENNFDIYRAFSISAGNILNEFSSAVIKPKKSNSKHRNIVVIPKNSDVGVEIEVKNIPKNVISLQVKVRNLSIHAKEYSAVQAPALITDVIRSADNIKIIDYSVKRETIYEYVVDATYIDGQVIQTTPVIFKFAGTPAGAVTTAISNVNISSTDILDVSFDIKSTIFPNDTDNTLVFLKANGLYDLYQSDMSGTRDALSGLVAHSIERVNKTTGQRENFGLIQSSSFSDATLYQQASVLPLEIGNSYRYEIFVNLRETEQLIKNFIKEKKDLKTTEPYFFNLQKFFHPIVRNEGMLVSDSGLRFKYPQSSMEHGSLGLSSVFEASFENVNATISNISAVKINKFTNNVSWKTQGLLRTIDHFLIFKQVHNIRTLIAAIHPMQEIENYVHNLNEKDNGPISYTVIAVYSDYSVSEPASSNFLVVDL